MEVNGFNVDLLVRNLKERIELADKTPSVEKPISYALYHLWKECDFGERKRTYVTLESDRKQAITSDNKR